jgi:subfamily B ATP-binding cassette protein MsbA
MTPYKLLTRLLSYSWIYWPGFVIAFVAMLIVAITEAAFPAMMKPLLDRGFQGATSFQVWWVPTAVLLIFLVRGSANFLVGYTMQWVANNVLRDLRRAMFEKLLCLPSTFFDKSTSGQLISKMIVEIHMVLLAVTNVVTVMVRDSLILMGLLAWLFWLNWKLTLIVLILLPFLALLSYRFSTRMREISKKFMTATGDMTTSIEEAIAGNRVIKVFGGEGYETKRFELVNSLYRRQAMRLAVAQSLQSPLTQLLASLAVAAILTIALVQSRSGAATVGDFVSFITAMLMMFGPLRHLTDVNSQMQRGLVAAESIFSLIDEKTELDSGQKVLDRVIGKINFQKVSFSYTGRDTPAIDRLTLDIEAGTTVAFVGPSGSGKTTLISLLLRLYERTGGQILIDDIPIEEISLRSLRAQFAVVSQDVILFNDTIESNIAYGRDDVAEAKLWEAIRAADLEKLILELPKGLQTIVGDRGVRLSGGQRQRIAIARAVIKDAPILILDEATSALDGASESRVKYALDKLRTERTTLVIAHRLSTVLNADNIVVMERGRAVQVGRHADLLLSNGLYRELYSELTKKQSREITDGYR